MVTLNAVHDKDVFEYKIDSAHVQSHSSKEMVVN